MLCKRDRSNPLSSFVYQIAFLLLPVSSPERLTRRGDGLQ